MGWVISVRSEFGKGSVFEVQILQWIVHEKNGENVLKLQNREKHEDTHISAPDAKILVVDDEIKIREIIKEYAEFEGYEVAQAEYDMQAVEMVKNQNFKNCMMQE